MPDEPAPLPPSGGFQGNVYDAESNPLAHYNRELLKVQMPDKASVLVEAMPWTYRTKAMIKILLYKLMSQEILLSRLSSEERSLAQMDFDIECIQTKAVCNSMDVSTPEFMLIIGVIRDHARFIFSRTDGGWERLLQATFFRRVEERMVDTGLRKPGFMEGILGGVKKPEGQAQ